MYAGDAMADPARGFQGSDPPPFVRTFGQNGVKITHFESGTSLSKPNIIVDLHSFEDKP
jgi:hypothetical protein